MAFLFHSSYFDPEQWRKPLLREDPSIDFRTLAEIGRAEDIDCFMAWDPPPGTFRRLPNLKLIYATGAGVDGLLAHAERPPGVPIARITDAHQVRDMTNFVIGAVLRHHLRFDLYAAQQARAEWRIPKHLSASRRRVGVMGLGNLGAAAAGALAAAGFQVAGWTRARRVEIPGVTCFAGVRERAAFLGRTDILVCMLPLTPETRGIINAGFLAQLPPGAAVINVGRGGHVVEKDLLAALDGRLSGATLDVFEREPLPSDHPFWRHPKMFVTPHVATIVDPETAAPQVVENLRRLKKGEPLSSLVDQERGY